MKKIILFAKGHTYAITIGVLIISLICITGFSLAYFTKKTNVYKNEISIGDVKINLVEESWDENAAKSITPGETLSKDPKVKNTGNNPAYVLITVKVPKAEVVVVNDDQILNERTKTELFTYTVNENFELLESDLTSDTYNLYVYGYTKEALKANETTNTLFDNVTYKNVLEGEIPTTEELNIDINACAIQSETIALEGTTIKDKITDAYTRFIKEGE